MSYFTTLWKNDTWARKCKLAATGYQQLDYAAASGFKAAGVGSGSTLIVVTVMKGILYVGGYIEVHGVLNRRDAAKFLGMPDSELWQAEEYAVADRGTTVSFQENCAVPSAIAQKLEFTKGKGFVNLRFEAHGKLDRQTLRGVRKLAPGSELALVSLLKF